MALCRASLHKSASRRCEKRRRKSHAPPSLAILDVNRLNSSDPFGSAAASTAASSSLKKAKPRIVILSVTQDASTQYVPIMNCIFTAQKNVRLVLVRPFCYSLNPATSYPMAGIQRRRAKGGKARANMSFADFENNSLNHRRTSKSTSARSTAPTPSFSNKPVTSPGVPTFACNAARGSCNTSWYVVRARETSCNRFADFFLLQEGPLACCFCQYSC